MVMTMPMSKCILMLLTSMFPVPMLPFSLFISTLLLISTLTVHLALVPVSCNVCVDVDAAPHVDADAVNDDFAESAHSFGHTEQTIPRQKRPET